MIWLVGLLIVLAARVFLAGMNSKSYFYKEVRGYNKEPVQSFDGDLVILYCALTAVLSLFWPVAVPGYGLYLLGRKYAK